MIHVAFFSRITKDPVALLQAVVLGLLAIGTAIVVLSLLEIFGVT